MKRVLMAAALIAVACIGFGGVAKADTCPALSTNCTAAGGVTWTFNSGGSDGSGGFLLDLTIGTTGSLSGTLDVFAFNLPQTVTNVSLKSTSTDWTFVSFGNVNNCGVNANNGFWCAEPGTGTAISVPGGTFTFVFDVTGLASAPAGTHIQAFQGPGNGDGGLSISNDVGIGGPPPSVPEPASLTLLGLGLLGVPFLRRKRS